jgi:hypothetical protein
VIFRYGFHRRAKFGRFLTDRGLLGHAVEVGVHQGRFAHVLLNNWKGMYTGVDHYLSGYDPIDPAACGDREEDYRLALLALSNFGNRAYILRQASAKAAASFGTGSLDFVYLDAKHRRDDVLADLSYWWPKVKSGGVLSGHDIVCPGEKGGGWAREIQPALGEFFPADKDIYLVPEDDDEPWSYYIEKT